MSLITRNNAVGRQALVPVDNSNTNMNALPGPNAPPGVPLITLDALDQSEGAAITIYLPPPQLTNPITKNGVPPGILRDIMQLPYVVVEWGNGGITMSARVSYTNAGNAFSITAQWVRVLAFNPDCQIAPNINTFDLLLGAFASYGVTPSRPTIYGDFHRDPLPATPVGGGFTHKVPPTAKLLTLHRWPMTSDAQVVFQFMNLGGVALGQVNEAVNGFALATVPSTIPPGTEFVNVSTSTLAGLTAYLINWHLSL